MQLCVIRGILFGAHLGCFHWDFCCSQWFGDVSDISLGYKMVPGLSRRWHLFLQIVLPQTPHGSPEPTSERPHSLAGLPKLLSLAQPVCVQGFSFFHLNHKVILLPLKMLQQQIFLYIYGALLCGCINRIDSYQWNYWLKEYAHQSLTESLSFQIGSP